MRVIIRPRDRHRIVTSPYEFNDGDVKIDTGAKRVYVFRKVTGGALRSYLMEVWKNETRLMHVSAQPLGYAMDSSDVVIDVWEDGWTFHLWKGGVYKHGDILGWDFLY